MNGMDATTGKPLSGTAHLAQRIGDILSTPIGTRQMRFDYGSLWRELIDQPANAATAHLLRAATALAIQTWEREFTVTRVTLAGAPAQGNLAVIITGKVDTAGRANSLLTLTIPLPRSRAEGYWPCPTASRLPNRSPAPAPSAPGRAPSSA
jgi:phage baseplate assembly protein W